MLQYIDDRSDEALKYFFKALELDPSYELYPTNIAYFYFNKKKNYE